MTAALIKLYKEDPRPQDPMDFLIYQMFPFLPKLEVVVEMKNKIKTLKREIENFEQEKKLRLEQEQMMKTDSEIESLLKKLFTTFDADETGNSLLKKHLNLEMFEDNFYLKTDYEGGLLDNINSGLTHYDSDVGIFASDQDAYETFEELFEPVLQDLQDRKSVV